MDRIPLGGKFLVLITLMFGATLIGSLPVGAQSDRESTFIIEGKDRQPSRSVFEYESDTEDTYSVAGTSDHPGVPATESIENPDLDKERLFSDAPETQGGTSTTVDEYGTLEMMAIGFGVAVVLLAL